MNDNAIKEELQLNGIKNTRAKNILLSTLKQHSSPVDVNNLHLECQKETSVNLVTVYRSLQQFQEKGLVEEFLGKDGLMHYEYKNKSFKAHPHFQCEVCHKIICLSELNVDDALYFANMVKQHQVNSISITLKGTCEACQK